MEALDKDEIDGQIRVVFSAADLPFGFKRCRSGAKPAGRRSCHWQQGPRAKFREAWDGQERDVCRLSVDSLYPFGMQTRDPQGSLIFQARWLKLHRLCEATDFFFTTQFVYFLEREAGYVVEVPRGHSAGLSPVKGATFTRRLASAAANS